MRLKQEKDVRLTEKRGVGVGVGKENGMCEGWGRGALKYLNLLRKLKDAIELGGWPKWRAGCGGSQQEMGCW